jgi:hypothetical protein
VLMVLRDTGIFDYGLAIPYLVFLAAGLLGNLLEWRYTRRSSRRFLR